MSIPTERKMLDLLREAHDRGNHDDLSYWGKFCPDCNAEAIR